MLDVKGILRDPSPGPSKPCYPTLLMDYNTRHKTFELMSRYGGGFCQKLAAAWFVADTRNKARIEAAFPNYLAEYGPGSDFWKAA